MCFPLRFRFILVSLALAFSALGRAENWPAWRGPRLDGTSLETNLPVRWSGDSNVAWKTALPGFGHASPIVWGDHVFTVAVISNDQARVLLALDRQSGNLLWQQTVLVAPLEKKHNLNSHASSTPVTDGELVYAAFLDGREMLVAAYDFTGRRRWLVRPGPFSSMHGFCSSPILHGDLVIVNGDHDGDSYLVALHRTDGSIAWKTPRENHTRSYCVPLIRELAGRTQMILSGDKCVASYDPRTGRRHWILDGPTEQFVASVVYNDRADLLFVTGGFPDHHILALKPDGTGNLTGTDKIVWRTNKGVSYVPSPISEGDYFLVVSDAGVAHCFVAKTGEIAWAERLGEHHASLVSAGGLVYFLNDNGVMNVVRPGPQFDLVARNDLGEKTFASPALSRGQIFIRTDQHLFCIGKSVPAKPTSHTTRDIEGWTVRVDDRLLSGADSALGARALKLLTARLVGITAVVPEKSLEKLREVPIQLDLTHGALRNMQYHPSAGWLKEHGYGESLAQCVHLPDASYFVSPFENHRQPWAVLHELAHAYHDRVLGFDEPRILAAWKKFRDSGRYKSVLTSPGGERDHYALTDQKEFFAEMTESYFGANDFYPFVAGELKQAEPEIFALLRDIWGPLPERGGATRLRGTSPILR